MERLIRDATDRTLHNWAFLSKSNRCPPLIQQLLIWFYMPKNASSYWTIYDQETLTYECLFKEKDMLGLCFHFQTTALITKKQKHTFNIKTVQSTHTMSKDFHPQQRSSSMCSVLFIWQMCFSPCFTAAYWIFRHGHLSRLLRGRVFGLPHSAHQDQTQAKEEPGESLSKKCGCLFQ